MLLREHNLQVARIDVGNRTALLDKLVVLYINMHHLARNSRAYLVKIAVHLRVVGIFGEGGTPVVETRQHDKQHHNANDDELPLALFL